MSFVKTTEKESNYNHLEKMSVKTILENINTEDKTVPNAVEKALPQIESLVNQIVIKLKSGGRLFYIGAGTSGRLGIVDASECPPTFGVPHKLVVGLIAGGDIAIRKAVEFAEDSIEQGWKDLLAHKISHKDVVVGIAASGTTPYVISALKQCNKNSIITGCISCNKNSPLSQTAKFPIDVIVGPEFVTGSSRMKAGTAQKLVLNMLTTTTMIQLGKIKGNKMLDMQLSNYKLVNRGVKMLMSELDIERKVAKQLLEENSNVRASIKAYKKMETKRTDKDVLTEGLKKMGICLVLLFLGPTLLYIAFSNTEKLLYIPLLILGIIACSSAIFFGFRGINTILDSMFKSNKST